MLKNLIIFLTFSIILSLPSFSQSSENENKKSNLDRAVDQVIEQGPVKNATTTKALPKVNDNKTPKNVYVIPIEGAIGKPILYILRKGIKEAIANNADAILLEMHTPGGELETTIKIMDALDKFKGDTITYINSEAISAGAYISIATKKIFFSPNGVIGAAAVISGSGEDIPETAKQKVNSYLRGKVRSLTEQHPHRAKATRAMMDVDFVFELDGETIKSEGELLTLTATEASKTYGKPPTPLLSNGTYESIDKLLEGLYGKGNFTVRLYNVTWSEELAKYLNTISPALMGLGLILLFVEFKTPGFGFFGITGGALLLVVFASNYVAGLAGYEEVAFFFIGMLLIFIDIFLFPGTFVLGLTGIVMAFGALIWAMADIWPNESFEYSYETFDEPLTKLFYGLCIAFTGISLLWRFLPHSWLSPMVLSSSVDDEGLTTKGAAAEKAVKPGDTGVALTDLYPSGTVIVNGQRYEAKSMLSIIKHGANVEVVTVADFNIEVKEI